MKKEFKNICVNMIIFLTTVVAGLYVNFKHNLFAKNEIAVDDKDFTTEEQEIVTGYDGKAHLNNEINDDINSTISEQEKSTEVEETIIENNNITVEENDSVDESTINKARTRSVAIPRTTNNLSNVKNYNIYYGYDMPDEIIESMGKYDLVIVDPINFDTRDKLNKIKSKGVKVYGYLSFAEVQSYDKQRLANIYDSDYLLIGGNRVQNWGCDIADIRSEHYKNILIQEVQSKIINAGFDGLFIDTLDDYEYMDFMKSESLVNEMTSETANLLERMNVEFPNLSIIVNRAFTGISKCNNRYIDAVLFECMNTTGDAGYFNKLTNIIDNFTNQGGICLSLSTDPSQVNTGVAKANEKGWIHFYRPDEDYTSWYEYLNK